MPRRLARLLLAVAVAMTLPVFGRAADPASEPNASNDAQGIQFFETKVRPLLVKHCYECHGEDAQESDLRLDTHDGIMRGGRSGMAVVAGKPTQSLLLTAVGYQDANLRMPPETKLAAAEVADLRRWIEIGAPHPDADTSRPAVKPREVDFERGRAFWAFQPPVRPAIPQVKQADWPTSPIDYFVLSKLEENGLRPAPPADRLTLIRRATFDLLGLPPTPAEVEQFLADESPEAFARLVERLLESPHYGERWGRHWLDVARYADSNGLDENIAHGNAWRYRDWVVAAFNADRPFDQFLREQIAGDLLPTDDAELRRQRLIATGFLTLGPKVLAEVDETKMEMDIVDEQIDTLGRAVMGMTFGCARCHDHKFDPIGTADYYALAGIFKSTRTMDSFTKIARWHENSIATEAELAAKAEHDQQVATKKSEIDSLVAAANEQLKQSLGEGAALPDKPETQYPEETKQRLKQLRDALTTLEKAAPAMSTAMGVTDGDARNVAVHIRGSHLTLGDEASRGWPRVLSQDTSFNIGETESGRLQLADWLTRPDHPLTGRVFVNRIWRWHFGRGIVGSTDNFGELGERPLNPELLDWLTVEFAEQGWSIKAMHRLIMLSSVYRMSSTHDPECAAIDPENRWQWRAGVRRLEAEAIRDAMLAVSGTLDPTMGGSLLHVGNREFIFNHTSKDETKYDAPRRSLYLPVIRNHLYDVFQLFDYTDAGVVNGDRSTSTVAPQALFMMNSELVSDAATALARRALNEPLDSDEARVAWLYRCALARPAAEHEVQRASEFVASLSEASEGTDGDNTRLAAWRSLCHVLLTSNEFIYVR